jgi:hypothetical protein
MNKQSVADQYFLDARVKLLDLAAFIDRMHRAEGEPDYRWHNLAASLTVLIDPVPGKTRRILEMLSDPTGTPIDAAPGKSANGAWPGFLK